MLKIGYLWIVVQVHIHEFRIYVDRSYFIYLFLLLLFFFVHSGSSKDFSCFMKAVAIYHINAISYFSVHIRKFILCF